MFSFNICAPPWITFTLLVCSQLWRTRRFNCVLFGALSGLIGYLLHLPTPRVNAQQARTLRFIFWPDRVSLPVALPILLYECDCAARSHGPWASLFPRSLDLLALFIFFSFVRDCSRTFARVSFAPKSASRSTSGCNTESR